MRVLLTGGGTGGHVNPALAIADTVKRKYPDAEIAFVGTKRGIENRLVGKEGYKIYHIEIQGIRRSLSLSNIKTAYYVLTSPRKAKKIIKEFAPDIVIGTGGYVCWPTLRAAADMGIPTMVHESNALPGVAVRQLQHKVDKILTNFEATAERLEAKEKIVNVGNPLRESYGRLTRAEAREKLGIGEGDFLVLSFGGSLGAEKVNLAALELMKGFSAKHERVHHIHASGSRGYEAMAEDVKREGIDAVSRISVREYIYDMPVCMAAADLVICRAGAMTLTEIAGMRKAAIIIPSPNVTDNHQYKNAKVLSDARAAVLIEEKELTGERICRLAERIYTDADFRRGMEENIGAFAMENVGERILEEGETLIRNREKIKKRVF